MHLLEGFIIIITLRFLYNIMLYSSPLLLGLYFLNIYIKLSVCVLHTKGIVFHIICSAQGENRYNSGIVLRKVEILTLWYNSGIVTVRF